MPGLYSLVDIRKIDKFFNENKLITEDSSTKIGARAKILRTAKLVMPSIAAIIISFIIVYPSIKDEVVHKKNDITIPKRGELEKLNIEKTVFSITNEENQVTIITADSLNELEANSKVVKITNPKGKLPTNKKGDVIDLSAQIGYFNQTDSHIRVEKDVKAVYADGSTVLTQSGEYDIKKSYGHGNDNIHAFGNWGKLWAQGFEFYQKAKNPLWLRDYYTQIQI